MGNLKNKIHLTLRDFSDNNKAFHELYLYFRGAQYGLEGQIINIRRALRKRGIGGEKYKKLLNYKSIHEGERCFIIATGPSLTIEDIESLKNEYTISMNSICKLYEKSSFRPTYFAVQDGLVLKSLQDTIRKYPEIPTFISDNISPRIKREKFWIEFPGDSKYHAYSLLRGNYWAKFSDDAYDIVYDGFSIAYSCIELAVYMGFKEIYLLGFDCTYNGPKEHFIDSGVEDRSRKYATPKLIAGYEEAKRYADANGIKIYNATRGGVLEVFERVSLDDVLKEG